MKSTRSASIQYRYVKTDDLWEGFDLKAMIVDILKRTPNGATGPMHSLAKLRKKDLDQDGSYVVLNQLTDRKSWDGLHFGGQLIHVKSGAELPGIDGSLDDDLPAFELVNLDLGALKQVVDGVLYFAVIGNHVGVIEGQRTRGRTLERYLTALLQDAGELEAGRVIDLNAKLSGNVNNVTAMTVKAGRAASTAPGTQEEKEKARFAAQEEGEGATVIKILELLGWEQDQLDRLQQSIPPDGWIEGAFRVLFKKRKTKSAEIDREVLEGVLRNMNPATFGLQGKGAKEAGGLVKLSEPRRVEAEGELLRPDAAIDVIIQMLLSWAKSGKIDLAVDR